MSEQFPYPPDDSAMPLFEDFSIEQLLEHEPALIATQGILKKAIELDERLRTGNEYGQHLLTRRFVTEWNDGEGQYNFTHEKVVLVPSVQNRKFTNIDGIVLRFAKTEDNEVSNYVVVTYGLGGVITNSLLTPVSYEIINNIQDDLKIINHELIGTEVRHEDPNFNKDFFTAQLLGFEPELQVAM
jgi:hypothetical protein